MLPQEMTVRKTRGGVSVVTADTFACAPGQALDGGLQGHGLGTRPVPT